MLKAIAASRSARCGSMEKENWLLVRLHTSFDRVQGVLPKSSAFPCSFTFESSSSHLLRRMWTVCYWSRQRWQYDSTWPKALPAGRLAPRVTAWTFLVSRCLVSLSAHYLHYVVVVGQPLFTLSAALSAALEETNPQCSGNGTLLPSDSP